MPTFVYTARDRTGNLTTGTLEADSDSRAAASLRARGLWVTELRPSGGARKHQPDQGAGAARQEKDLLRQLFPPVSSKDLAIFYRQLHTMLHSGMGIFQALELLGGAKQTPNAHLKRVAAELAQHALAGQRLSEGMVRYPWLFDRMQLRMVEAGEMGGMLVDIFRRLAEYMERDYEIRLEIKKRTLYPKLLVVALVLIPPIPVLVLQGLVPYLMVVWGVVSAFLMVGVPVLLILRLMLTRPAARDLYDRIKLAIPVIGPLIRKLAIARFARTLAALYGAGVPVTSALVMAGESTGNSVLEGAAAQMVPALEQGTSIAQAMVTSGFFPHMFTGMVSTGEATGNMDDILDKAAEFYEQEGLHATIQLVVIMGVLAFLVMAILIAIQVIGSYTSFYGGYNDAAGGAAGGATGE